MQGNMKNFIFVVTVALAGQLAAASPFPPCHIQDFYGKTVQQIKLDLKFTSQPQPSFQTKIADRAIQRQAPWGLARISHAEKLTFGTLSKYVYDPEGGENVNVYILDTGINIDHEEFEGRAIWGTNVVDDSDSKLDDEGSGTHYAGTVASRKYGVSKKANVIAVKTLGMLNPNVTSIIKGIEWTTGDHKKRASDDGGLKGGVMMLAAGQMPVSAQLVEALDAAYEAGIHIAISAGDQDRDACDVAAGHTKGLVVGATTLGDERASISNTGKSVDVFAPGMNIQSIYINSVQSVATLSGIGQAAAHVAGLKAYFISAADKGDSSPDAIKKKILDMAVKGRLQNMPEDTASVSQPLDSEPK